MKVTQSSLHCKKDIIGSWENTASMTNQKMEKRDRAI